MLFFFLMTENKRIHVPDNRSSSLNMPLTLRQQHWEIHKFSSIKNYILYSRLINSFSLFLKIIWWNEQSKVLSHNKSELLVSLLWLLSSLRPGQKFRYHLPEGHATEDALMLCPQLKHSIHNPLPPHLWVELCQLCYQSIKAAHGAIVLWHKGSLCCRGDAHHLPVPDAGLNRRRGYQLERTEEHTFPY